MLTQRSLSGVGQERAAGGPRPYAGKRSAAHGALAGGDGTSGLPRGPEDGQGSRGQRGGQGSEVRRGHEGRSYRRRQKVERRKPAGSMRRKADAGKEANASGHAAWASL